MGSASWCLVLSTLRGTDVHHLLVVLFKRSVCLRGRGFCPGLSVLEAGVPYMLRGADAHRLVGAGSGGYRIGGIGSCPELGG